MSAVHSAALDLTQLEFFSPQNQELRRKHLDTENGPISTEMPSMLLALRQHLEFDEVHKQAQFEFDGGWSEEGLRKMQQCLLKQYSHLLQIKNTGAVLWLDILLWFIAPFQYGCSELSFQGCCEGLEIDFQTERQIHIRWVAARLRSPSYVKDTSFQAHCLARDLDARELRNRLLRKFEPDLLN